MAPRVFISYDRAAGEPLRTWVRTFADELRAHGGTDARVDLFDADAQPGQDLVKYLQDNLQAADAVLLVCTPGYRDQLDQRTRAAGVEASILSGERLQGKQRTVIAVVREGEPDDVVPPWVLGTPVDLRGEVSVQAAWEALLDALHPAERLPPPAEVGPIPVPSASSPAHTFRTAPKPPPRRWNRWAAAFVGSLALLALLGLAVQHRLRPLTSSQTAAPKPRPPTVDASKTGKTSPPSPADTIEPAPPSADRSTDTSSPRQAELNVQGGIGVKGKLNAKNLDRFDMRVEGGTGVKKDAKINSRITRITVTGTQSIGFERDLILDGSP